MNLCRSLNQLETIILGPKTMGCPATKSQSELGRRMQMPKAQTTTKVITLIFDVPKNQEAELEEKWQQHLAGKLTLAQVLTWLKKWQVESLLK